MNHLSCVSVLKTNIVQMGAKWLTLVCLIQRAPILVLFRSGPLYVNKY